MRKKFDFDNNPVKEAFRAGNTARKKETAQDVVSDIITRNLTIDELEQAFREKASDLYYNNGFVDIIREISDKYGLGITVEENRLHDMWNLYEFGDHIGSFKWSTVYDYDKHLEVWPVDTTIGGFAICRVNFTGDIKIYKGSLEMFRRMLLRLPGKDIHEAFRAGNRARKKESAADTVESVSNTITFEELWDLFNTPEIKYSFETMLDDLIAKHGLNLETGRPDIHRQHGYRHLNLYRDNERICEFYWNNEHKGNNTLLAWLYMVPQDSTIAGCALCVIKNSADIKLYANAVIRLKQVLLGEHGDDFANEAFKAGNRARKKESAQDTVESVDSIQAQIDLFKEQTGKELEIRDGRPYFEGTLWLEGCTGLTRLPAGLKVRGGLELEGCTGLTRLPDGLEVRGSLWMNNCTGLTSLPADLEVGVSLYLEGCTGLTRLPDGLEVGGWLALGGCTGLTSLPAGLKVKNDLSSGGCTGLTSLPAGLEVGGTLFLGDCTGLTSLPADLKVRGSLDLCGCTRLTRLPDGLKAGGRLSLNGCTGLTSLPNGLEVGGDLNLKGCTGLTSLPTDLKVGGSLLLDGSGLSEAFKAGNHARKKESAQDAVQDVEIDRMPDWSGTPHETFEDMHRILMDIDLSTKRISTDDSIYNQEFTVHSKKKPFESFSAAVFDARCCIDFYLENDVISMTALPIGSGVMTLFSPSPGYRKAHRPYTESNMGYPQWKIDPELWTELLSWIDRHETG